MQNHRNLGSALKVLTSIERPNSSYRNRYRSRLIAGNGSLAIVTVTPDTRLPFIDLVSKPDSPISAQFRPSGVLTRTGERTDRLLLRTQSAGRGLAQTTCCTEFPSARMDAKAYIPIAANLSVSEEARGQHRQISSRGRPIPQSASDDIA
jgi:hypothetical protein